MVAKRKGPVAGGAVRKDNMTPEEREREYDRMIGEMGGLEYVRKTLALFRERHERLSAMYGELKEKYPDKWVALADGDELIVADSSKDLSAKLYELGVNRDTTATKLIRSKPRRMIL